MSYVIDEINGALQLEEGLKAEKGAMKIEIPRMLHVAHLKLWKRSNSRQ